MSFPVRFGKFLLLERVNVGGMAEVFKAKATGVAGFERILAIKRILPNLVEDDEFIRMFIDEARIAVQLNHANIVQIYELGKQGEHYYIAMEYIPSRDLRGILDRLRASGQLMPIAQAAYITAKVAEGLDYAHRRKDPQGNPMNIIHRDVSPQNVLVGFEGDVKVIDFGIAKAANRASKTQAGVLKGKFGYMSPEQVRGLPIDRRSDIFAVGVLLYEMLTGERLFIGESDFSTLERVRNADVIAPTSFNKKISPQLEQIVLKTLAREVEDRYQWASELARDLQGFVTDATGAYNARRVAASMREMYAPEVALEKKKLEEFMRIAVDEPSKALQAESSVLPLPNRTGMNEAPARSSALEDELDDGSGEFGEDKTFVIEASAAGMALGAQATDPNLAGKKAAPTDADASEEVSLYGGNDDDDDDARTLVGAENPYYNPPPAKPEAPTRPMTPQMAANMTMEAPPEPPSMPPQPPPPVRAAVPPGRSFDAVAAAMAEEDADALMAVSGSMASSPRGPSVPFGVEPASSMGMQRPDPTPAQAPAPQPELTPENALIPPPRDASFVGPPPSVPWVPAGIAAAVSATMLLASLAFVGLRATAEGSPAELVLSPIGTAPAGVIVSLDGVEIGRALPLTTPLSEGAHTLDVVAAGVTLVHRDVVGTGGTVRQPVFFPATPAPPPGEPTETPPPDAGEPKVPVAVAGGWRLMLAAVGDDGAPIDGAEVFVNGRPIGLTPIEAELDLQLEQVAIKVKKEGYTAHELGITRNGRAVVGPATISLARSSTTAALTPPPTEPTDTPPTEPAPPPAPAPPPEPTAVAIIEQAPPAPAPVPAPAPAPPPSTSPPPPSPPPAAPPPPSPPPAPKKAIAQIQLGTSPYAEATIDGRKYGMTPFFGPRTLSLTVGSHKVEFLDKQSGKKYRYQLKLKAPDPNNKVVIQFNKTDPPKVEGQVELRKLD